MNIVALMSCGGGAKGVVLTEGAAGEMPAPRVTSDLCSGLPGDLAANDGHLYGQAGDLIGGHGCGVAGE